MAADHFDPYYKWLGIPPEEQPPTHYRLLGLVQFEADHDVIANAASRQSFHLRQLQTGPQAAVAQRLLKEVAAAKATLLSPEARAEYDRSLAPDLALPTDEIVPVATFRKKPAKAKGFDPTALLFRLVPVVLFAGVLVYVLRVGDRKDVSKPPAIAAGASDSGPSDTVDNPVPYAPPISLPADQPAAAVYPAPDSNEPAADPAARNAGVKDRTAVASPAVEPSAAGTAPRADALATADMEAGSAFEADSTKEPVPSDDDQSKASKQVRSKYKADFAKAKTTDQKGALAKTLLAEGRETEDDPTNRYAILMAAIDLATAAGDFQSAVDGWSDLGEHFQVDALAGQWKVLEKSSKPKQVASLKVCLQQFVDDSLDQQRYDLARGALKTLLALSKPEDAAQYESDLKNLDTLVARSAEAKSALEKLKTDPSDPAANRIAGEFLSFFKLDWSQGLLLLSRSDDAMLKALARDELAKPDEAKAEVRLADAWWDFAEGQADGRIKASAKSRARFWYMEALPDLQGDDRQKAERRATLEARVHRQSAAEANITPQVLKSKFQGKASYDAQANWLTVVYDFQDPAQLKDFQGDAQFGEGEIAVPRGASVRHVAKFKTLKMTGTVTMKSKTGDVVRGSAGLEAQRDGSSVKISSGADAAGSSEKGPTDDDLVLLFELDANEKLVLFRLGDEVVGKPMAKSEPGQIQLCGGEAGAQFSQLAISGQPDPEWLVEFFGLPKARVEKDSSGAKSSSSAKSSAPAKAKMPTKFERVAKVVLWNEHNSGHNNSGTRACNLILRRSGKTVWQKKDLEIPWEPNQPTKLAVDVPQIAADSVRLEITAWHGESGGLSEVEVLDKAGKSLAAGAQVLASAEHHPGDPRSASTLIDGITDSQNEKVGYWLALNGQSGWADIRLLPQEAPPAAAGSSVAANKQPSATKEPAKAVGKSARKSLEAKVYACCDDAFELCVNGAAILEGKENEIFSAGAALAAGDVITVKARNNAGNVGFCCVIKFSNEQVITTSDGWKAYTPANLINWSSPKVIQDPIPAIPGNSDWGMSARFKSKFGVDADEIWAPGGADVCYLFYVVGRLDIPKKTVEK